MASSAGGMGFQESTIRFQQDYSGTCRTFYKSTQLNQNVDVHPVAGKLSLLNLEKVLHYSGDGRGNVVWHPKTGAFAYSSCNLVVIENLEDHKQTFMRGHRCDVSVVALSANGFYLASAAGVPEGRGGSPIFLCDLTENMHTELEFHDEGVQALSFDRNSQYLVSIGVIYNPTVCVWDVDEGTRIASQNLLFPVHSVSWSPDDAEFVTCGTRELAHWTIDPQEKKLEKTDLHPEASIEKESVITAMCYATFGIIALAMECGTVHLWNVV
eukprot:523718_1